MKKLFLGLVCLISLSHSLTTYEYYRDDKIQSLIDNGYISYYLNGVFSHANACMIHWHMDNFKMRHPMDLNKEEYKKWQREFNPQRKKCFNEVINDLMDGYKEMVLDEIQQLKERGFLDESFYK